MGIKEKYIGARHMTRKSFPPDDQRLMVVHRQPLYLQISVSIVHNRCYKQRNRSKNKLLLISLHLFHTVSHRINS